MTTVPLPIILIPGNDRHLTPAAHSAMPAWLRDEIQRLAQFADQATRMEPRDMRNNMETLADELSKLLDFPAQPATEAAKQAVQPELMDWDAAHKIAFQAAAAFRPSYFNGAGFMPHNWVVEAIRSGHLDGQRLVMGLPPIDRSGQHAAALRMEREATTQAAQKGGA